MNLFRIGVTVSMIDKVTGGMHNIAKATMTANAHVNSFQSRLNALQSRMDKFSAAKIMGEETFRGTVNMLGAMIDPAKEYHDQIVRMNMAGIEHGVIVKNIAAAWDTASKIRTTSPAENLKTLMELRSVLTEHGGSMTEARELLPRFQQMKKVMIGAAEIAPEDAKVDTMAFDAVKAAEMVGNVSKEGIEHMADMFERVMITASGKLTPANYQTFFKYAGAAKLVLDEDTLFNIVPELMIEMLTKNGGTGGIGGPGTRFGSLFSTLVNGVMSKQTTANLAEIGMLDENGQVLERNMAGTKPQEWTEKVFVPHILQAKPELEGNEIGLMLEIARIIKGPRLTTATLQELHNKTHVGTFGKWREMMAAVPSEQERVRRADESTRIVDAEFEKSWTTLMTVLGNEVLPIFIPTINMISQGFSTLATIFTNNPWMAKAVAMGTVIVGVTAGIVTLVATAGIAATVIGAAGASFELISIIGLGVTAVVMNMYLAFKLIPPACEAVLSGWNFLMNSMIQGMAQMIKTASFWIGTFISRVNPGLGQQVMDGGADIASKMAFSNFGHIPTVAEEGIKERKVSDFEWDLSNKNSNKPPIQASMQIAAGAINITQQPGENSEKLAQRIIDMIKGEAAKENRTTAQGIGIDFSSVLLGAQ